MKVLALLFAYGQSSHGVATPIRDTPRDDLSIQKSNVICGSLVISYIGACFEPQPPSLFLVVAFHLDVFHELAGKVDP